MIGPQLTAKINELRLKFREWLLSVSEQVPAVKRGPVAFLQQVQAERRDEAKKFLSSSAPETHQSIRFEEISLFEIIEQEQELRLHKRLNRLFTDQRARERLNEFFASDERIAPGPSWLNVGLISRDSAVVSLFSHCACDDLPTEVSRIGVTLERIIPSLVLLTFHAQLAQEVTYAIEKLQRTPCLPEIRFVPWWPFGKRRGYSRLMAQDTTVKTATRFRCDIRAKIEQCVRRLMNGRSTVSGRASVVQLPATEVFSIAEPSQTVDGAKWQLPASDWLVSFGIDLRRRKRETYRSSSELFIWQADSDH
jgi:hypothetical protein